MLKFLKGLDSKKLLVKNNSKLTSKPEEIRQKRND